MNLIDVIKSGDYLVLDTETTGLGSDAEICQIAIIDAQGNTLLDTLVKPVKPIPEEATAIHGITNEMVAEAQPFPVFDVFVLLNGKNVIIYNADYDSEMLYRAEGALGWELKRVDWREYVTFYCAMKHFAPIYGDWNDYRKSYRWKSLSAACDYYNIPVEGAHDALQDCLMTLKVCKAMLEDHETAERMKNGDPAWDDPV